jgi:hypothetical protein
VAADVDRLKLKKHQQRKDRRTRKKNGEIIAGE